MKRIEIEPDDDLAKKYVSAARVMIETLDGKKPTKEVVFRIGDWRNPASMEQLIEKFKSLMPYSLKALSKERIDRLIENLVHLEKVEDMRQIIALLVP